MPVEKKKKFPLIYYLFIAFFIQFPITSLYADELRIAVASNFSAPIKTLADRFEQQTGHNVILAFGSTGKHFSQIVNGAPFNAFFAADEERPTQLEKKGLTVPETRFTYAIGRLVLWSSSKNYVASTGVIQARSGFNKIAIANPRLAPYGKAAQQFLQAQGLWKQLQGRIVRGENIAQTFQFIMSGNAQLGFIAYSQLEQSNADKTGVYWIVDSSLHDPINQQAVLLKDTPAGQSFLEFVKSEESRAIIQTSGYDVP